MNGDADSLQQTNVARLSRMLKERLLPELVSQGALGDGERDEEGWILDGAEVAPIGGLGVDHYASTTLTVSVDLSKPSGEKRTVPLVCKCMLPGDGFDSYNNGDVQAQNEVNMYTKIFPFFKRLVAGSGEKVDDLHPRCYYAECRREDLLARTQVEDLKCVTLMEDIRAKGFRLTKERLALDRQHVSLALRAIGRMHALSYAAKARCREEFLQTVTPLLGEACFNAGWDANWGDFTSATFMRGVKRLAERLLAKDAKQPGDVDAEQHQRRLDRLRRVQDIGKNVFSLISRAVATQEPHSVIVHGDFLRNNMQFHYDQDGKPTAVCLFDFQNSRYCPPSLDVALFVFLNTSPELRATQWDNLLNEYFVSLKSTLDRLLEGHDIHPDFVMPTMQSLREDLKKHALQAYVVCSYFLPQVMTPEEEMPVELQDMRELCANDRDRARDIIVSVGGDKATEILADMVLELLDRDLVP